MEEKLSLISDLISLAHIDGNLNEDEIGFIHQVGNMMGLTDADMIAIFKEPLPFNPQKSEFDRIVQFHRMVLLMNVDRIIEEQELKYIRNMGIKLGLNPKATNEVLRRMNDYEDKVIPPDEMISIFKTHYN